MVRQTFFRKITEMEKNLELMIQEIEEVQKDRIVACEMVLLKIDEIIREVKNLLKIFSFDSTSDEIRFFKERKPKFISKFIFYSKVLHMETTKPMAGNRLKRKFYQSQLAKLKDELSEDLEFYNYYRRKATYLDHKYFTRKSNDLKMRLSLHLYDLDEDFTTSHDYKVALYKANTLMESYLLKELKEIELPSGAKSASKPVLSWTSSKVSLLEVLYSLHITQCFNGGNIDFKQVVREAERTLDVDLGNFYKTLGEIRGRKYNRTKFLQLLADNLNSNFLEGDS